MTKLYLTTNGKNDYLIIPCILATKLTKYYWVAVNQSGLGELVHWGTPPRPIKMPPFPDGAAEEEIRSIVENFFGVIVAEREDGENDKGLVGINAEKWEAFIDRHGIPDF